MSETAFALIFVVFFFGLMIGVSILISKRQKVSDSSDDYLLAGRKAPLLIVAGSFFATFVSTATIVGYAGTGYTTGLSGYWGGGCFMVAAMWSGIWIVPRLRRAGITTVPEIFEKYFGSKHRIVALILSLGRDLGITASAVLVLSQIFTRLFGLGFWTSVILTAGVVVLFTSIGGMWAVLITDTIQSAIIIGGTILMIPLGIWKAGGFASFVSQIPATHTNVMSVGFSQTLGWFLIGVFTMLGYQTILQRGLAAKDDKTAKQAFFWGGFIALLWYIVPFLLGIIAKVLFPDILAANAFYDLSGLFGTVGNVFFMCVLLMAGMSTVSSCILTTTSNISLDVYKRFINPNASQESIVRLQKCSLLAVVVLCTIAGHSYPYVIEITWIGGRLMASGLAPVLTLLILWPRVRRAPLSCLLSMIGGSLSCVAAEIYQSVTASSTAVAGSTVVLWSLDPILAGLPISFLILLAGTALETSNQTHEFLLQHQVKQ